MSRVLPFLFGVFLVFACLFVSLSASADQYQTEGDAYAACEAWVGSRSSSWVNPRCSFVVGTPGPSVNCVPLWDSGSYYNEVADNGNGVKNFWCVAATCTAGAAPDGEGVQYASAMSQGDLKCQDGCWASFNNDFSVSGSNGSGFSVGTLVTSGDRCSVPVEQLEGHYQAKDSVCDPGQLSCFSPSRGYCATTQSGEMVCEPLPPAGQAGCATGATGATCVGNGTPPPSPPDPPISKGAPPDSSGTATGSSGSTTYNYTTNNYSGTSPGPGPSSSSADQTSGTSGSNENASGNSPGPNADHGTDANGKCPDGSVPTASGCSGSATDSGCDTPPACFGDAVMCASFREQVAIRCNTAKAASGSSSGSSNIGDPAAALAGAGVPADGGASGDPSTSGLVSSSDLGEDGFDASGLGFSRTCPANPVFDVLGHSYTLDLTPMCNFASLLGWFVLLVASLVGLRIVATGKA